MYTNVSEVLHRLLLGSTAHVSSFTSMSSFTTFPLFLTTPYATTTHTPTPPSSPLLPLFSPLPLGRSDFIPTLVFTAVNTWGLLVLTVLLGYGLVEVPRSLWNASRRGWSLNYCYFKAAKLYSDMCEAADTLAEMKEVSQRGEEEGRGGGGREEEGRRRRGGREGEGQVSVYFDFLSCVCWWEGVVGEKSRAFLLWQ